MEKKRKWLGLSLWILLILLVGCGKKEVPETVPKEEPVDWKTEGFQCLEEVKIEQVLWEEKYLEWEHEMGQGAKPVSHLDSGVCGECFWYLGQELDADGIRVSGVQAEYCLDVYDTTNASHSVAYFTPEELGLSGELGYVSDMDMLKDDSFVLRWSEYAVDEQGLYHQTGDTFLFTDLKEEHHAVEMWETFAKEKIEDYATTILPLMPVQRWRADGKGNLWILPTQGQLWQFDGTGALQQTYEVKRGTDLLEPFLSQDGELILPVYDGQKGGYEFLWLNGEAKEVTSLGTMPAKSPIVHRVFGLWGNELYYMSTQPETRSGEGIVKWNIKSGERQWIYEFPMAGVTNYDILLAKTNGQPPTLRMWKHQGAQMRDWLVPLTEQQSEVGVQVQVADLRGDGTQLEMAVAKAAMETPYISIAYTDASAEEAKTRLMAEWSSGTGPDILYVSMSEFEELAEKGLLRDWKDLLSEELAGELLPGTLELGRREGVLLGMPAGVCAETFAMSEGLTTPEDFSLEKLISLMEEGKLNGQVYSPYLMDGYLSPDFLIQTLLEYCLEDSFLIDWKNRKSNFADERFVKLLELVGKTQSQTPEGWAEQDMIWGYFCIEADMIDFFERISGEQMQVMGYPGSGGSQGYLVPSGGMVVVNADTKNPEGVRLFIEALFSQEVQKQSKHLCLSVRRPIYEDFVTVDEEGNAFFMGRHPILVYEDGTTAFHRAMEFLENCVAPPREYYHITKILFEELNTMYAEGKNPKQVAEIINNRVQVYLDEEG